MTTSISQLQHAQVSMGGMKTQVDNNQEASGQGMLPPNIDLSALDQPHTDPLACGKQVVEQNKHLLASLPSEPSSPVVANTPVVFEDVLVDSKQLGRELNISDDNYAKVVGALADAEDAGGAAGAAAMITHSPEINKKKVMAFGKGAGVGNTPSPEKSDEDKKTAAAADKFTKLPHIAALDTLIETIHTGYQKNYAKINEAAAKYMRDVNTAVGKISECIDAGSDGKIKFNRSKLVDLTDPIFAKYSKYKGPHNVWSPDNSFTKSICHFPGEDADKKFWEKKLGSDFTVERLKDEIHIYPNLEPIRNIHKSIANIKPNWDDTEMSSQAFQSMQSAIDSQKSAVNSTVSQLLEKFRQDNSTFETLIQLLHQMTQDLTRYNAGYYF